MERRSRSVADLSFAFLTGWLVLVGVLAGYIFISPHDSRFAPEVGRTGAFLVFGVLFSFAYAVNFFAMAIPAYFDALPLLSPSRFRSMYRGMGLFAASSVIWSARLGWQTIGDLLVLMGFAVLSGGALFYALPYRRAESVKEDRPSSTA
jgi:hypothetical protein